MTDEASVTAAFNEAIAANGPLSIVIANAGAAESAPFTRTGLDAFERMIAVNLTGVFLTLREGARAMTDAGWGRLDSDRLDRRPARLCLRRALLRGEARRSRVLSARSRWSLRTPASPSTPSAPATPRRRCSNESVARIVKKTGRTRSEARKMLADINPGGRLVEPQEVADAVLKLCSPASDRVTGQAAFQIPEAMPA